MIDGSGYGLATDVWSLGIVVLVLCEGSVPHYREANPRKAITLISELPAPRLTTPGSASTVALDSVTHQGPPRLQPWAPELLDFVAKSLEKDPLKRASLTSLMAHPWVSEAVGSLSTSSSPSSAVLRELVGLRETWAAAALGRLRRQAEAAEREARELQREREEEEARLRAEERRRVRAVVRQEVLRRLRVLEELARAEAEQEVREREAMAAEEAGTREFLRQEEDERRRRERLEEGRACQQMYVEEEIAYLERWRLACEDTYHADWVCKQSEFMGLWNPRYFVVKEGVVRYYDSGEEEVHKTQRGIYIMSPRTLVQTLSPDSPLCLLVKDEKESGAAWSFVVRCSDAAGVEVWRGYLERNRAFLVQRMSLTPFQVARSAGIYKSGWLEKESEYLASWNRRFFVIDKGVIRYFDNEVSRDTEDASSSSSVGGEERGKYVLSFASDLLCESSEEVEVGPLDIYIHDANAYTGAKWVLRVRCADDEEKRQWAGCIERHMRLFLQL
jgi:hypothetical protein